jgi:hypothetical protein
MMINLKINYYVFIKILFKSKNWLPYKILVNLLKVRMLNKSCGRNLYLMVVFGIFTLMRFECSFI